jgi:diaminohydroxyphosphoribosylaminopyrimidine deaminase/5-amino-6-(5-phosphoribosylamino)uracil reductase
MQDADYMARCLELAKNGLGYTKTNPLVGSVIVHNDKIIGEGFHQAYGQAHAEVKAIASVKDVSLLRDSTLYVNLEPCAHHGKTPPCADLIVQHNLKRVVIACQDSFEKVDGLGIKKLKEAGIQVEVGVLEKQSLELNKRFFTYHQKKRPYIVLKWAQSLDGFIDRIRKAEEPASKISSPVASRLVHQWRSQEQGIVIGKNTLRMDNPSLDARYGNAPSPTVIVVGFEKGNWTIFQNPSPKILFGERIPESENVKSYPRMELEEMLKTLYYEGICSVMVEGGANLLNQFLTSNYWDEIRVVESQTNLLQGVRAPILTFAPRTVQLLGTDRVSYYSNV